ncbi:hypothetical protein BK142_14680 [Paenibacillus glucanolyticus]|nr:hypothetical protein BK142_14680 [Paenibacillus glucanolyticus]
MLVLSTAHIQKNTAKLLEEHEDNFPLVVYEKGAYGFWICVPDPEDLAACAPELPSCLFSILQVAIRQGVQWVMLDRDVETVISLPTYSW